MAGCAAGAFCTPPQPLSPRPRGLDLQHSYSQSCNRMIGLGHFRAGAFLTSKEARPGEHKQQEVPSVRSVLPLRFRFVAGVGGWIVLLRPFGALQPALGHLIPCGAALRVVREGSHVLAFGSVAAEFLSGNHGRKSSLLFYGALL